MVIKMHSTAYILPAFNETDSIFQLIGNLNKDITKEDFLIVIDDSVSSFTEKYVRLAFSKVTNLDQDKLFLIRNHQKSGRGKSVRQGFNFAISNTNASVFVEMDSDGSHSAEMAKLIATSITGYDYVIGSRYLPGSSIKGWSFTRIVFSKIINKLITLILGYKISDWTNGLRAYSRDSVVTLLKHEFVTQGFISLSEQAIVLASNHARLKEVPIIFYPRSHGKSTVTWKEIKDSFFGLVTIYRYKNLK
jgi:dolichol-phosphate mannosyltransferase